MNNGLKTKKHKIFFPLLSLFIGILLLFIALLPSLLSTSWGKQKLFSYLRAVYQIEISCQRLSLKWFGHQEITNLVVTNATSEARFTCDMIKTEATLFTILFQRVLGHLYFDRPHLVICTSPLSWFTCLPGAKAEYFQSAAVIPNLENNPLFERRSNKRLLSGFSINSSQKPIARFSLPYYGSVSCTYGKVDLLAQGMDPVYFDEITLNVDHSPKQDLLTAHFSSKSLQKGIEGALQADVSCTQMQSVSPILDIQAHIRDASVKGIDQLLSFFEPHFQGLLPSLIGQTANMSLLAKSDKGNFYIDFSADSPLFTGQFSLATEETDVRLVKPGQFALQITPELIRGLGRLNPRLEPLVLQNSGSLEGSITQFSSSIPHTLKDLLEAVFSLSVATSTPLYFTYMQHPLTLDELSFKAITAEKGGSLQLDAQTAISSQSKPALCNLSSTIDLATCQGTYTATATDLPTFILSQITATPALTPLIGPSLTLKASGNIGESLQISAESSQLTMDPAQFSLGERCTLVKPVCFVYHPPVSSFLTSSPLCNGSINTLAFPLSHIEQMQFDAQLTTENVELNVGSPMQFKGVEFSVSLTDSIIRANTKLSTLCFLPFQGAPLVSLQDILIPFQWDTQRQTALLDLQSKVQEKGQSVGSLALKSTFSHFAWDTLDNATINALLDIQQLPSSFLDAFTSYPLFSPLLGPSVNSTLKIQSTPKEQTLGIAINTALITLKASLSEMNNRLFATTPLHMQWSLTPEGYRAIERFSTGPKTAAKFKLKEPTLFQFNITELSLPLAQRVANTLKERIPKTLFDMHLMHCVGSSTNSSILFLDTHSGELLQLSSSDFAFKKKAQKDAPLTLSYTAEVSSQNNLNNTSAHKPGSVYIKANLENLFDKKSLDALSCQISAQIKNFPSALLDLCARLRTENESAFTKILGSSLNAYLQAELKNFSGPISLNLNSPSLHFSLDGKFSNGALLLDNPLHAQMKIDKETSRLFLSEINPLSLSYFYSDNPITMQIPAQGFYFPLHPYNVNLIAIPQARIELGRIACRNEGNINIALGLLKTKQFDKNKELPLWFAPLDLHLKQGVLDIERTEILLADMFDVALWGKILLKEEYIDMVLGLTASALSRAFGIKNLPGDYVLTIPIKGKSDNVKINSKSATAKIALLLAAQQKSVTDSLGKNPAGALFGGILQQMGTLPDNGTVPPAKHPFPWEKSKTSFQETSEVEAPRAKKRHFKQNEKPLKQILKLLH